MNWKAIIIGGLVFYAVLFVLGFATGPLIHEGVLDATYQANETFWRPELRTDPPDIAALMPYWIVTGLLFGLVVGGLYSCLGGALEGSGTKRGAMFALCLAIFTCAVMGTWSGIFNLPSNVWIWWGGEALVTWTIAGAVMGWAVGKWAS